MSNISQRTQVRKRKPQSQLSDTTRFGKQKRTNESLKRAGTIQRIILKNFMCHSMLDVDLSVNINIVIGRNGSGKSAILTALIVGLGGKASLTNRGNSIKGFIKAGKSTGNIEIQLFNGGSMSYRPNVYGDVITIIRNFTANGSSSYKIKDANGKTVATKAREIQNITTALNIQVDNPICILNQDVSRNFLNSNDPRNKFELFMKATKLETLLQEYKKIQENRVEANRMFEEKSKNFRRLQEEAKNLKSKIHHQKSIVEIRDKIKLMQVELLWAKVRDAEKEVVECEETIKNLDLKRERVLQEAAARLENMDKMRQQIDSLNQQLSEFQSSFQVQMRPQEELKTVIDGLKTKFNEKRRHRQLVKNEIESKNKEIDFLRNEILAANENMSRVEQEKMHRLRDLTSMNEKLKGMDEHLTTCRNDLDQITSDICRQDNDKRNLRSDILRIDQQIRNEQNTLTALQNESGNALLLYGENMPRVKQQIEQNRKRFKELPRGPLGSYIKLKEKKWAIAVESFLKPGLLMGFAVDNKQDNLILVEIFKQIYGNRPKPTIITSKFHLNKHDVRANLVRPPSDCAGMYESLEIDDPIVANCIIDQTGIENIMLVPSDERAQQLLTRASNVPKNCRQALTIKGDVYLPDPNYKTYANRNTRARFLQVDTKEHVKQLKQAIVEIFKRKQTIESQYSAICEETRRQGIQRSELEEKIRKMNTAKVKIRHQLEELKASAEPEVASVDILETELTEIENSVQQKQLRMSEIDAEIKNLKEQLKLQDDNMKQLQSGNLSLEQRIKSLEEQIRENVTRQKEVSTSDEFDKRKVKQCQDQLNEVRHELNVKQTFVTEFTGEASLIGERVETERKIPEISNEIKILENSVRKIETITENTDELLEKYNRVYKKFQQVSTVLQCLNTDIKELVTATDKRKRHYKLTEEYFITYVKHSFTKIMELRQFEGSIDINLEDKTLDLIVIPPQGSQGVTRTANLSGGERSFSTVAFLYSLWQCMEFPFYFLDEFDVYMDKLNRSKVIDILLHHAESHPELQFVFLTPQDVSFIKKNIQILRLQDPERNALEL